MLARLTSPGCGAFLAALVVSTSLPSPAPAAIWTSYLAIEVPGTASQLYEVQYDTSLFADPTQITGADLLQCIFGAATNDGMYNDAFFGTYQHSTAMLGSDSVGYLDFFGSPFVESFGLGGTNYAQDTDYDPSWAYFAAGGTGDNALGFGSPGAYGAGSWTYSGDGLTTRYLSNGSYDAWVLTGFDLGFNPLNNPTVANPAAGDFATARIILHGVPEPSRTLLLGLGASFLFLKRRRTCRA